jgi:hypothetical protein
MPKETSHISRLLKQGSAIIMGGIGFLRSQSGTFIPHRLGLRIDFAISLLLSNSTEFSLADPLSIPP